MNSDLLESLLAVLTVQRPPQVVRVAPKPLSPAERLRIHTLPYFFHNVEKMITHAVQSGRFETTIGYVTNDPKLQQAIGSALEADGFRISWEIPVTSSRELISSEIRHLVVRW